MKSMLVALCATTLLLPAAAMAENPFAKGSSVVRSDDLDLSKPADQRRLELRLTQAAEDVCGRDMDRIHNVAKDKANACKAQVLAESRARYDALVARAITPQALAMN